MSRNASDRETDLERETDPEIRVEADGSLSFPAAEPVTHIRPSAGLTPASTLAWSRGYVLARTTTWGALRNRIAVGLARLAAWVAP